MFSSELESDPDLNRVRLKFGSCMIVSRRDFTLVGPFWTVLIDASLEWHFPMELRFNLGFDLRLDFCCRGKRHDELSRVWSSGKRQYDNKKLIVEMQETGSIRLDGDERR
jgi:hypothetical protein